MVFVFFLQASQDGDAFGGRRFVHQDLLEPAFQGLVFLKVLLVFIQRGRADGAQFAARQSRFQDVGRIHCPAAAARTHQGVDLIDKQDDFAGAVHHFLHHAFQALLKLALVLGARDERAHIQGIDGFAFQVFRDVPVHDFLGDALRNGGLAHAGLAHQDGVILGSAAQDLQHATNLFVPPDHRIQLPLCGHLVQIHRKLVQKL